MLRVIQLASAFVLLLHAPSAYGEHPLLFNVGLPRTGTLSLHHAVPLLNFSSCHVAFNTVYNDLFTDLPNLIKGVQNGEGRLWDYITGHDAFGDTPFYGLVEQVKERFPNAKLVATWRDKASWMRSMVKNSAAGGAFLFWGHNVDLGQGPEKLVPGVELPADTPDDVEALHLPGDRDKIIDLDIPEYTQWQTNKDLSAFRDKVYDEHERLLAKYNIPKIDIMMTDQEKWRVLLDNFPSTEVTAVARKCLAQNRLEWPNDNKGLMSKTYNRILPKMSKETLQDLELTCNFALLAAAGEAEIILPFWKPPQETKKPRTYLIKTFFD